MSQESVYLDISVICLKQEFHPMGQPPISGFWHLFFPVGEIRFNFPLESEDHILFGKIRSRSFRNFGHVPLGKIRSFSFRNLGQVPFRKRT